MKQVILAQGPQCYDAGEARTSGPSVSSTLTLSHCDSADWITCMYANNPRKRFMQNLKKDWSWSLPVISQVYFYFATAISSAKFIQRAADFFIFFTHRKYLLTLPLHDVHR